MSSRICELVLDTSGLLLIAEGVDPISEAREVLEGQCSGVDIVLLPAVLDELTSIASGRGRRAIAARIALSKLSEFGSKVRRASFAECTEADECILKYSESLSEADAVVLTVDKELASMLKRNGIKYITWWRSKRRFVLIFPGKAKNTNSPTGV